jgi:hypothetical protein
MSLCYIPVSLGELYDKYSILQIKSDKISDLNKLKEVNKELDILKPYIYKFNLNIDIQNNLKHVNELLWNIEDDIREKENKGEFDNEFIELARLVYKTNDKRASIKSEINKILNSEINEIKSYSTY